MPFTNHSPVELTPDFTVDERVVNHGDAHTITFSHSTPESRAFIEGSKATNGEPDYSFGWQTHYLVDQAYDLMNEADTMVGLMAKKATLIVCRKDGIDEYGWTAGDSEVDYELSVSLQDLRLPEATLVRIDTEDSTIGWDDASGDEADVRHRMWVITADDLTSPWIQEIYDKTVEEKTRAVIARNLGVLTAGLTAFLKLPFGECTLDNLQPTA